jgi:hypothetical protein
VARRTASATRKWTTGPLQVLVHLVVIDILVSLTSLSAGQALILLLGRHILFGILNVARMVTRSTSHENPPATQRAKTARNAAVRQLE